ncbi:hypothetical protein BC828DRAFT_383574 [Blastocladiella britannica]|nr:hypothetical protein BC828DRAFT_383574 [Blastocladiella britannica]
MDHAYLESTVAPALATALSTLSIQLAGLPLPLATSSTSSSMPPPLAHPTIDPIDYLARYLLRSLHDPLWDADIAAAESQLHAARDQVYVKALDTERRARRDADEKARDTLRSHAHSSGGDLGSAEPPAAVAAPVAAPAVVTDPVDTGDAENPTTAVAIPSISGGSEDGPAVATGDDADGAAAAEQSTADSPDPAGSEAE